MKRFCLALMLLPFVAFAAYDFTDLWPDQASIPHYDANQTAGQPNMMSTASYREGVRYMPFLHWQTAPKTTAPADGRPCLILISGGAYSSIADMDKITTWKDTFTALGIQCVVLYYRVPRSADPLPIYQAAWDDGQRAVRMVRSMAAARGLDPDKIGVIGMSAGSHLATLLATSSLTPAYTAVDDLDSTSAHIDVALANAIAYGMSDGLTGTNSGRGIGATLDTIFKFDENTCPMCMTHGGADSYSPLSSSMVWRRLRAMDVTAELHTYPDKDHGAYGLDRHVEFLRKLGWIPSETAVAPATRWPDDSACAGVSNETYTAGALAWYHPAVHKTASVQILLAGPAAASPEVSDAIVYARRYLNATGITVVTAQIRSGTEVADAQAAVAAVRADAAKYGLNADYIGLMGYRADAATAVAAATTTVADNKVRWVAAISPTTGASDAPLAAITSDTPPTVFIHEEVNSTDSAVGSVASWEKQRELWDQGAVHTLAAEDADFISTAAVPGTAAYTYLDRVYDFLSEKKDLAAWTEPEPEVEPDEPVEPEPEYVQMPWFEVQFQNSAFVAGADWIAQSDDPAGGTFAPASGVESELVKASADTAYVQYADDKEGEIVYTPSTASPADKSVHVTGRAKVASRTSLPAADANAAAGLCFISGFPYGFAGGSWTKIGVDSFTEGEWVDYDVEFDLASASAPRVRYTVGTSVGNWIALDGTASQVVSVRFEGGSFGNFKGTYEEEVVEPQEADPDTSWMAGSFGVSFHWTAKVVTNNGTMNWEQAVNAFDVEAFADSVESFGAQHVIFTTAHAWQQLPCPCVALDNLIPGRTTERDLLKDIIDELTNRNIRVVFYYNHSCNHNEDQAWDVASGYDNITDAQSMTNFADNICAIVRELSLRYGDGVSAWWFDSAASVDDSLPWSNSKKENNVADLTFPWDNLFAAARAGNPRAAVAVNWDVHAVDQHGLATDYLSGETEKIDVYGNYFPFAPADIQDHIWTCMDSTAWFWNGSNLNTASRFSSLDSLKAWKASHRAAGRMATLNLVIDEAGNINPVVAQQLVNAKTIGKVWVQGRYDPTTWQAAPSTSNLVLGLTAAHEGNRSEYTDGYHRTPTTVLTDGAVPSYEIVAGAGLTTEEKTQIFEALDGNVLTWNLAQASDVYGLNLYSRSTRSDNNGGTDSSYDAIVVNSIEVLPASESNWVSIGAPAISFGVQDGISGGALAAKLVDGTGAPLATGVTAIRFTQGACENGASLLVEAEVLGCAAAEQPDQPEEVPVYKLTIPEKTGLTLVSVETNGVPVAVVDGGYSVYSNALVTVTFAAASGYELTGGATVNLTIEANTTLADGLYPQTSVSGSTYYSRGTDISGATSLNGNGTCGWSETLGGDKLSSVTFEGNRFVVQAFEGTSPKTPPDYFPAGGVDVATGTAKTESGAIVVRTPTSGAFTFPGKTLELAYGIVLHKDSNNVVTIEDLRITGWGALYAGDNSNSTTAGSTSRFDGGYTVCPDAMFKIGVDSDDNTNVRNLNVLADGYGSGLLVLGGDNRTGAGAQKLWMSGSLSDFNGPLHIVGNPTTTVSFESAESYPADPESPLADGLIITNGVIVKFMDSVTNGVNRQVQFYANSSGTAPTIYVEAGKTVRIDSTMIGESGFIKTGEGTLVLGAQSTGLSGTVTVSEGQVVLDNASISTEERIVMLPNVTFSPQDANVVETYVDDDPVDPPPDPQPGELVNGRANMKGWAMKRISTASKVSSEAGFGWSATDNPSSKSYSSVTESVMTFNEAQVVNTIQLFAPPATKEGNYYKKKFENAMVSAFNVYGSNDGSDWESLLSVTGESDWLSFESRYYTFRNEAAYTQYKLVVVETVGGGDSKLGVYNYFFAKPADPTKPWTWDASKKTLTRDDQSFNNPQLNGGYISLQYGNNSGTQNETLYDLDFSAGVVDTDGNPMTEPLMLTNGNGIKQNPFVTRLIIGDYPVTISGNQAFQDLTYLFEAELGTGTSLSGMETFKQCYSLNTIDISKLPAETIDRIFTSCYNLSGEMKVGNPKMHTTFATSSLVSVDFEGVTEFGDGNDWLGTFDCCRQLKTIVLGSTLQKINGGKTFGRLMTSEGSAGVEIYWKSAPPEFYLPNGLFHEAGDNIYTNYLPLSYKDEWTEFANTNEIANITLVLPETDDGVGTWTSGSTQVVKWWDDAEEPEEPETPVYALTIPAKENLTLVSVETNGVEVAEVEGVYSIVSNTEVTVTFAAAGGYELTGSGVVVLTVDADTELPAAQYPAVREHVALYVSPTAVAGVGDGSYANPYTMDEAWSKVEAGETIQLLDGTYFETVARGDNSVFSVKKDNITFAGNAEHPERVIIDFDGSTLRGIYDKDHPLTVRGITFQNKLTSSTSGVIGLAGTITGTVLVEDCRFVNIATTVTSGADTDRMGTVLFGAASGDVILRNCEIKDSSCYIWGVMYMTKGNLTISGCTVTNCHTKTGNGCLVGVNGGGDVLIEDSDFKDVGCELGTGTTKDNMSGILHVNSNTPASVTVRRCRFWQDPACGSRLGAFSAIAVATEWTFEDCEFYDFKAGGGWAGLFYLSAAADLSLSGCVISNCSSTSNGGVIGVNASSAKVVLNDCTISDCQITGSSASDGNSGGLLYVAGDNKSGVVVAMTNCVCSCENGNSYNGGQIFIGTSGCSVSIDRCAFNGCTARNAGGVLFSRATSGEIIIRNTLFNGGAANNAGGSCIYTTGTSDVKIENCTFVGNTSTATGSKYSPIYPASATSSHAVKNCIFWNNKDSGGTLRVTGSTSNASFENCVADVAGLTGVTQISASPFVDAENGDYTLARDVGDGANPCIDGGVALEWIAADSLDLAGNSRLVGSAPDIGAYEAADEIAPAFSRSSLSIDVHAKRATVSVELATLGKNATMADVYFAYGPSAYALGEAEPVKPGAVLGDVLSISLNNLTPETTYAFAFFATNDVDQTVGGLLKGSFTTTAAQLPALDDEAEVEADLSTATVSVEVAALGEDATSADVLFAYGTDPEALGEYTLIKTVTGVETVEIALDGLSPATTYYYSIYTTNNLGVASSAVTGDFSTRALRHLTLVNPVVTSHATTADVTVQLTELGEGATSADVYIAYGPSADALGEGELVKAGAQIGDTGLVQTLSDLEPDTTYYYAFFATNNLGEATSVSSSFATTSVFAGDKYYSLGTDASNESALKGNGTKGWSKTLAGAKESSVTFPGNWFVVQAFEETSPKTPPDYFPAVGLNGIPSDGLLAATGAFVLRTPTSGDFTFQGEVLELAYGIVYHKANNRTVTITNLQITGWGGFYAGNDGNSTSRDATARFDGSYTIAPGAKFKIGIDYNGSGNTRNLNVLADGSGSGLLVLGSDNRSSGNAQTLWMSGSLEEFTGPLHLVGRTSTTISFENEESFPGDPANPLADGLLITNGVTVSFKAGGTIGENRQVQLFANSSGVAPTIYVEEGETVRIDSTMIGESGFIKTGGGTLVLGAQSTGLSGTVKVSDGVLVLDNASISTEERVDMLPNVTFSVSPGGAVVETYKGEWSALTTEMTFAHPGAGTEIVAGRLDSLGRHKVVARLMTGDSADGLTEVARIVVETMNPYFTVEHLSGQNKYYQIIYEEYEDDGVTVKSTVSTEVKSLMIADSSTYTWKATVEEGDWNDPENWTCSTTGTIGYPNSLDSSNNGPTAKFASTAVVHLPVDEQMKVRTIAVASGCDVRIVGEGSDASSLKFGNFDWPATAEGAELVFESGAYNLMWATEPKAADSLLAFDHGAILTAGNKLTIKDAASNFTIRLSDKSEWNYTGGSPFDFMSANGCFILDDSTVTSKYNFNIKPSSASSTLIVKGAQPLIKCGTGILNGSQPIDLVLGPTVDTDPTVAFFKHDYVGGSRNTSGMFFGRDTDTFVTTPVTISVDEDALAVWKAEAMKTGLTNDYLIADWSNGGILTNMIVLAELEGNDRFYYGDETYTVNAGGYSNQPFPTKLYLHLEQSSRIALGTPSVETHAWKATLTEELVTVGAGATSADVYFAWGEDPEALGEFEQIGTDVVSGATFTIPFADLEPETPYYYAFFATNDIEEAVEYRGSFTTTAVEPLVLESKISAGTKSGELRVLIAQIGENAESAAVTAAWGETEDDLCGPILLAEAARAGEIVGCSIDGLTANTEYFFVFEATNNLGAVTRIDGSFKTPDPTVAIAAYDFYPTNTTGSVLVPDGHAVTYAADDVSSPYHVIPSDNCTFAYTSTVTKAGQEYKFFSEADFEANATARIGGQSYLFLSDAVDAAESGDTIELLHDNNFVAKQMKICFPLVINGNGHTVKVRVPYVDPTGYINTNCTKDVKNIFMIQNGADAVINDMTVMGGGNLRNKQNDIMESAVAVENGGVLKMENVTITRSNGGIVAQRGARVLIDKCQIVRNCRFCGGGIFNRGVIVMNDSSVSENRSTGLDSTHGGGGAAENQGEMYINNCVICNNVSGESGGAINNFSESYDIALYLINSTVAGNFTTLAEKNGGGISLRVGAHNHAGEFYSVNNIICNNYHYNTTSFQLTESDIRVGDSYTTNPTPELKCDANDATTNFIFYTVYGGFKSSWSNVTTMAENVQVTAANQDVFLSYYSTTRAYGWSSQTKIAIETGDLVAPDGYPLALYTPIEPEGKAVMDETGVTTYFDYSDWKNGNVKMSYAAADEEMQTIGNLAPAETDDLVTTFYETRFVPDTIERTIGIAGADGWTGDDVKYKLRLLEEPVNGTVKNISLYGDSYKNGTEVTVVATPDAACSFLGWYYADDTLASPDAAFTVVMDRNIELKAKFSPPSPTHTLMIQCEQTEGDHGLFPLTVTTNWIGKVFSDICPSGIVTEEVEETIESCLNARDEANGLNHVWMNYVLGAMMPGDPNGRIWIRADQTRDETTLRFRMQELAPTKDCGFTVKYRLNKKPAGKETYSRGSYAESGSFEDKVTLSDLEHRVIDLIFIPTNAQTSAEYVTTVNTAGVVKVDSMKKIEILASPWAGFSPTNNPAVKAADYVKASSLTTNDVLYVYDQANSNYLAWAVQADGTWRSVRTFQIENGVVIAERQADALRTNAIPRGAGVWLERQDVTKPIYLYGQVDPSSVATPLAKGWNLVGNPFCESFDVSSLTPLNAGKDHIVIPTGAAPLNCTYQNGEWGYTKIVEKVITLPGGKTITGSQSVRTTEGLTLPPGLGFWYVSGGESEGVLNWKEGE